MRRNATKEPTVRSAREAALLSVLSQGECYGLEARRQYEEMTGEKLPLGALYTTLQRIEAKGFVKSRQGESTSPRGGNHRRYFRLTGEGHRALQAYLDRLSSTASWHQGVAIS